jgi:hypothetical protein
MQNPNQLQDPQKPKRLPGDWNGLGNEPRNENLAKIRVGSFEKQGKPAEKDTGSNQSNSFKKNKTIRRK